MSKPTKLKVEASYCFVHVASVIGKSKAKAELFKAFNSKGFTKNHTAYITDGVNAFVWRETPQGREFWNNIYMGINPYGEQK